MNNEVEPKEVAAISAKILELIEGNIAASREVVIAALKVTATIIDEAHLAQFGAQVRAGMLLQSRGKR